MDNFHGQDFQIFRIVNYDVRRAPRAQYPPVPKTGPTPTAAFVVVPVVTIGPAAAGFGTRPRPAALFFGSQ